MALIQCNFFSETLNLSTSMTVILPQQTMSQIGMQNNKQGDRHPTLYLLHGYSDDDTAWLRQTSIERYVASLGLAVVMPQVHHSFYTDMAYGHKFWTFISEELPYIARSFFPLSGAREDNFAAGLSMGGYGAIKWALRHPERFAAAASLSGALDIASPAISSLPNYSLIFGEQNAAGTDDDLLWLLEQRSKEKGPMPMLYQCCGIDDFLYADNVKFRDVCNRTGFDLTYEEGPGNHDWAYWDAKIQDVLNWLPLRNR
jgi:putative tributyrin esterase